MNITVKQRLEEANDVIVKQEENHQHDAYNNLRHCPKLFMDTLVEYIREWCIASMGRALYE